MRIFVLLHLIYVTLMLNSPHIHSQGNFTTILAKYAQANNAINLSNNHSDFPCPPDLLDSLVKHISEGKNKYAPDKGAFELRELIANKYNNTFGTQLNPHSDITITAGATQAIYTAISSLIKEDDEVIVFEPAFKTYVPSIEARGARPIFFHLNAPDFEVDWNAFTKLITQKTKLVILNSPHSPTGKIISQESLEHLQRILQGTQIHLLSDETFSDMVYDDEPPFSIGRYPLLAQRSVIIGSLGKALCVPGWKIGYCIAPQDTMESIRKAHSYLVSSVNLPIQLAIADYLSQTGLWSPYRDEFQSRRDFFSNLLAQTKLKFNPVQSGYFQVCDFSDITSVSDVDFCINLAQEHGVTAFPVSKLYHDGYDQSLIRLCFGKDEEELTRAVQILSKL